MIVKDVFDAGIVLHVEPSVKSTLEAVTLPFALIDAVGVSGPKLNSRTSAEPFAGLVKLLAIASMEPSAVGVSDVGGQSPLIVISTGPGGRNREACASKLPRFPPTFS